MSERERKACVVCGKDGESYNDGTQWLLLNRYGIGTGKNSGYLEPLDGCEEYAWREDDGEFVCVSTGLLACWPGCAINLIDSKMAEIDGRVAGGDFEDE